MGFKGEIGYQTFLYSNEPEIRSLFMFLVEKLPRESAEASDQPAGTFDYCFLHLCNWHMLDNDIKLSIKWKFTVFIL